MAVERIDPTTCTARELHEHLARYQYAAQHVLVGERVLDAACGTGYARGVFEPWSHWTGVDAFASEGVVQADLTTWTGWRELEYDVFVGIETYEHLHDVSNYLDMARAARRAVVLTTPIIPTTHTNKYHVRDHDAIEVINELCLYHYSWDLEEYHEDGVYGYFAFKRRP